MMEDMGQMGNSDEAVMPDDIPFDLSDLDMEDDKEYNVGGFVPATSRPTTVWHCRISTSCCADYRI